MLTRGRLGLLAAVVLPLLLLLAACGGDGDDARNGDAVSTGETNSEAVASDASAPAVELSDTHELTGFGFTIDYPGGWFAETRVPVTVITELEEDFDRAFSDTPQSLSGLDVRHDHRSLTFLADLGLSAEEPTLDELVEFNIEEFELQDVRDRTETTVFGVPAISIRFVDEGTGNPEVLLQGFLEEEAFLLGLSAPSEEALDAFLPTWEGMLKSIRPSEAATETDPGAEEAAPEPTPEPAPVDGTVATPVERLEATCRIVDRGEQQMDETGLHVRGVVSEIEAVSADPRLTGDVSAVLNFDVSLDTGEGTFEGEATLEPDAVEGMWVGTFSGKLTEFSPTGAFFSGRAESRGTGELEGLTLTVDFETIDHTTLELDPCPNGAVGATSGTALIEG